jgi:hypothetical protein
MANVVSVTNLFGFAFAIFCLYCRWLDPSTDEQKTPARRSLKLDMRVTQRSAQVARVRHGPGAAADRFDASASEAEIPDMS